MSEPTPTPSDDLVYREILAALRNVHSEGTVASIERTVARGVVLEPTGGKELIKESRSFRPTDDTESLAISIEFLMTRLEVPMMLERVQEVVGNPNIEWRPERPGTEAEEVQVGPVLSISSNGRNRIREALREVVKLASELKLTFPEVA